MLNDSKKIAIFEKIIHIAEKHVFLEKEEVKEANERYVIAKGLCFILKDWEEHYNEIRGIIYRELKLGKTFSSDYVNKFIDVLASDTIKKGIGFIKENPLEIDIFKQKFQKSVVYMPIAGIELHIKELKVGNIKFVKMNKEMIISLAKNKTEMAVNNPYFKTPSPKEVFINFKKEFSIYDDKTCAIFEIFAENKIALELAKIQCENVLDLLQFYSYIHFPAQNIEINFDGEVNRFYSKNFSHGKDYFNFYSRRELKGPIHDLIVSNKFLDHMEKNGLFKASRIYEKKKNTDFEKTIITGIHWFVDSLKQREVKNQFLSLIITLEILLTPSSGNPISNSIAEAIAIILESNLENRKQIKNTTKKLYNKRNSIVHGRISDMPTLQDLKELRKIASLLILWTIFRSEDFEKKDALLEYIEDCKLEQYTLNIRSGIIN